MLLRLTSLWLALLVLTASVGLTVQQHTCHVSGRTQRAVVLTPRHGCAPAGMAAAELGCQRPAPLKQTSVKGGCCEFSAHHHKVEASAHDLSLGKVPVPALVAVLPAPPMWPPPAAVATAAEARILHAADASPPPRAGRALLTFVCVLVV
ncbi:hypothetical protein DLM85_15460 [Hymenobacter edaphi]|uniref:Uncharacterized protein n=1 Tax=Hymenobacter edaphi TaxID=2211146 RepID=A0A328BJC7_9BACT|nr:hypothetical protein DLM85_15460 [Hymenobacter edaphi]